MDKITSNADYQKVFRRSLSFNGDDLVLRIHRRGDKKPARFGLVVSNKCGKAVVRTRLKRVIREAVRDNESLFPVGCDVVIIARPSLVVLDKSGGMHAVSAQMQKVLAQYRH